MRRYALRDDQWDRIKDILPGREGHVGGTAKDNRLFVEAVLFRFRAEIPWRDLPERFGCWKIVYQRFNRWAKSGVFERVFRVLASDHDNEYMMIDATIVRARRHSAEREKKDGAQAIGRSRGGLTTKIHAPRRRPRRPTPEVMLSPGQDHDLACAEPLIEAVDPGALIADKAFDADAFIAALDDRAIVPRHPVQIQPKHPAPMRFRPLLRTQSRRAFLQHAQAFPGHRHSLRQTRQDLPRRRSPRLRRHPPQLNTGPRPCPLSTFWTRTS